MKPAIAIVGMACCYPDAVSPQALWENALAQRRAFRRIPPQRLSLADYSSADPKAADRTYATQAAVLENYEFDRVGFRVAGDTYRAADPAHWLALDMANRALDDAGFSQGKGLPRERTGVVLGNTLTGEFSRANVMRLRWPYVRRVLAASLESPLTSEWSPQQRGEFLRGIEALYKKPFPPVGAESLAGALSNTIAGRICNHFDLGGGGYIVDGACASSLLAIINACSSLVTGDLDVAVTGGVDLSLDPFELVGFAKVGALAHEQMRVYDARSDGFWPGEGCGIIVLMRYQDALARGRRVYGLIGGWGISSDGAGGITRPEVDGQLLALQRAYAHTVWDIDSVAFFEGHGTGTKIGDTTELRALSRARRESGHGGEPAAIGSIKANIGHTKAAAGVAGLIKAVMAVHHQVLPPTTGCEQPHRELTGDTPALRVLREPESWPTDKALRAGISAMGFGGINTHIVIEGIAEHGPTGLPTPSSRLTATRNRTLFRAAQDSEVFLLDAGNSSDLRRRVGRLLNLAAGLSQAELTDLAARLAQELTSGSRKRAALVASTPSELTSRLEQLSSRLSESPTRTLDVCGGVYVGESITVTRIGFLFPGQGSSVYLDGGALARRFEWAHELYSKAGLPSHLDGADTQVAQPAIVIASAAGMHTLSRLGVSASVAIGHSVGELAAFHWAGVYDEDTLLRIARARGKAMADLGSPTGAMASIGAGPREVETLIQNQPVVIAGLNSPRQTVVSGEASAIDAVVTAARKTGVPAVRIPVSHAFHSPLVAAVEPLLAKHLSGEKFRPTRRSVVSTITGMPLQPDDDLRELLCRQISTPVRFSQALEAVLDQVDLLVEVGPGTVLTRLVKDQTDLPVIATEVGGDSLKGLLHTVGAAFVLGAEIDVAVLFAGRLTRPISLDRLPKFLTNPCELAPISGVESADQPVGVATEDEPAPALERQAHGPQAHSPLEVVRELVASRAELPLDAVQDDYHLLNDLHLNSITVGQLVAEAASRLGMPAPTALTEYANATVAEVAIALQNGTSTGASVMASPEDQWPAGVDTWFESFTIEMVECPLQSHETSGAVHSDWSVIAPADHALADRLRKAFAQDGTGSGVIVCLPANVDEDCIDLLLDGARMVSEEGDSRFVLVQHGNGAAAFARTLHLEMPHVPTCVVDVPIDHPQAVEWVRAEALAATTFTEAHYDTNGRRCEPRLQLLARGPDFGQPSVTAKDILLVTGGGKGIAAECALHLARQTGVRLALLGRSEPQSDEELRGNLERMSAAGVTFRYVSADVTDAEAVRDAVAQIENEWGPVTALLHAAGSNEPRLIRDLNAAAFRSTLAPKVQGMRNLLEALDPKQLRLLVVFGSIISRIGLRGEADYAVANEWLRQLTERWGHDHPDCRCLAVEWSVWSGVGMGQRLGRLDSLMREGITPITPDDAVRLLSELLSRSLPSTSVVVTGRFGSPPTLKQQSPALPLWRFLERPRVHFPGIELITEAELSPDADPYLDDHVLNGERLFPAVMGLEAIAQVAMALTGSQSVPLFEDVHFIRPIVIAANQPTTIRVAGLVRAPDVVDVIVRCETTDFQADHFRARCRFGGTSVADAAIKSSAPPLGDVPLLPIDPAHDLYGGVLFHSGRFQRILGYRHLRATECVADLGSNGVDAWFGRYHPGQLVLGDPAVRDAAVHAIQACIPHARLIPVSVKRIQVSKLRSDHTYRVRASERTREGDNFTYDSELIGPDDSVVERWEGLVLQKLETLGPTSNGKPWALPLLGPYLERRVGELIPGARVALAVAETSPSVKRRDKSDQVIQQALGRAVTVRRRTDGKPEADGGQAVSTSHSGDLTLAAAGSAPLACDVEAVAPRDSAMWLKLLGRDRNQLAKRIAQQQDEDSALAATRVWAAGECLKKAGLPPNGPLTLQANHPDGWVLLSSGCTVTATFAAEIRGQSRPLVMAVLVGNVDADL